MKKINKKLIISCCLCLLPILIGLIYYKKLPENIAIHFDINNNPDNYFQKDIFIFGMPVLMALLQAISMLKYDDKKENRKVNAAYSCVIPLTTIIMYIVTIMYALGNSIDIRKIVMILLGILFIITGNYTPKSISKNFSRVPKRLLYFFRKKYNRIYGYMLVVNGIIFIISVLFKPIVSAIAVVLFILESIFLYLYALIIRK